MPRRALFFIVFLSLFGCAGFEHQLSLRRVVLYQSGVGYFERSGELRGDRYRLSLRNYEVGDVLKSMVVIDRSDGRQRAVSAVLPAAHKGAEDEPTQIELSLRGQGPHDMTIAYAAPTPVWKPSYRVVLPEAAKDSGLLQAWAIVNNASGEPWRDVELVLATGAPLSFAVDLQTPHFVARPDGNGHMVQPVATGLVEGEQARALANSDKDSDGDGIPDRLDKCPSEPETYNGVDDDDGCPDRGRVIVRESRLEILDKIYFENNSAEVRSMSEPLMEAIAATLRGNSEITLVEVQGHACTNEAKVRELAERRAAAVRQQLIRRGIAPHRLSARGYGVDRPVSDSKTSEGCERNRRTEFVIAQRSEGTADGGAKRPQNASSRLTAESVARSAQPSSVPTDIAGAAYYQVSDPVSLPRSASTMVSMLTLRGGVEDIYLFRPDANISGSDRHPLRAARLHIGQALEPGPVTVFARGSFVGEGALSRMHPGETAFVPYALDSAARIKVQRDETAKPLRLIAIHDGEATVEDEALLSSRYEIATGAQPPARIFLRHPRRTGYAALQLPPETEEGLDAWLLPQALSADSTNVLSVVERREVRHQLSLKRRSDSICPYVGKKSFAPPIEIKLSDLCRLQQELERAETGQPHQRQQLDDLRDRAEELRNNLKAIEKIASAATLRTELLARLSENERRVGDLQKQLITRSEAQATAEARLVQLLADLQIDEPPAR